jgi:hypothetical protein
VLRTATQRKAIYVLLGIVCNEYERFLCDVQVHNDRAPQRVQQDLQDGVDRCYDSRLLGAQLRDANPHPARCLG